MTTRKQEMAKKAKREDTKVATLIIDDNKDVDDTDSETGKLTQISKDYKPRNIFNAERLFSLFQCLPQKALTFKNKKCFECKKRVKQK